MSCRAFADSKTLKDEQREALFADIRGDGRLGYAIESVSAAYISARMLRRCDACCGHRMTHQHKNFRALLKSLDSCTVALFVAAHWLGVNV